MWLLEPKNWSNSVHNVLLSHMCICPNCASVPIVHLSQLYICPKCAFVPMSDKKSGFLSHFPIFVPYHLYNCPDFCPISLIEYSVLCPTNCSYLSKQTLKNLEPNIRVAAGGRRSQRVLLNCFAKLRKQNPAFFRICYL